MKYYIIVVFIFFSLSAENNTTCIEKLNQLNRLKSQKASIVENTVAYMFSGNMLIFSKSKDEKKLAQKIRVLKMELKSCIEQKCK